MANSMSFPDPCNPIALDMAVETDRAIADQAHKQTSWKWDSVTNMVLYGLGSPRSSVAAR